MSVCVVVVEIIHMLLVILNVVSDSYVLWSMYEYKDKFETDQSIGQSAPNYYNYSFCYPTIHPPQWFDITVTSTNNCSCSATLINCNSTAAITNPTFTDDINCDNQYWALGTQYQQIFMINDWECETCQCKGSIYVADDSLPIQKMLFEYNELTSTEQHSYCTPQSMVHGVRGEDMANDILALIICSWVFIFLGCICQCGGIVVRLLLIADRGLDSYNIDESRVYQAKDINKLGNIRSDQIQLSGLNEKLIKDMKEQVAIGDAIRSETNRKDSVLEKKINLSAVRLLAQFVTSVFHDIPHTIIGIYYVAWEYSDYGSQCFAMFIEEEYPKLTNAGLDPKDTFAVIVAKNVVLWSYVVSFVLILFNAYVNAYGMFSGFDTKKTVSTNYEKFEDNRWYIVYFLIFLNSFAYVFAIWCPTFGVIYFSIAATFYKQWTGMLVMFIVGCVSWAIMCCSCTAFFVTDGFGVIN